MKKILCLLLLCITIPALAMAGQHELIATWTMPDVPVDLAGFQFAVVDGSLSSEDIECLDDDDLSIIDVSGAETRTWSGTLDVSEGDNLALLRSIDTADQHSVWVSAPFNPPPSGPVFVLTIIR